MTQIITPWPGVLDASPIVAASYKGPQEQTTGRVGNLQDWKPLPNSTNGLAFTAWATDLNRWVEVRLLPWAQSADSKQALEKQVKLIHLLGRDFTRTVVGLVLEESPPRLVLENAGESLGTYLSPTTTSGPQAPGLSIERTFAIAAALACNTQRLMDLGVLHGCLSPNNIWIDAENRVRVDYCSRFYEPTTAKVEPTSDDDAAVVVQLLCELLGPFLDTLDQLPKFSGQQRGQLRNLLRQGVDLGREQEQLLLWTKLLSVVAPPEDSESAQRLVASPIGPSNPAYNDDVTRVEAIRSIGLVANDSSNEEKTSEIDTTQLKAINAFQGLPACGERIGKFRLDALLGQGGMGAVYRGIDLSTDSEVAIKVLRHNGPDVGQAVRRFNKEARLLATVQNDYVTRLYEAGYERGFHYLAMEYVAGTTLKDWMSSQLPLEEASALGLIADVARALVDAHAREIIHRDIKPENILLGTGKTGEGCAKEMLLSDLKVKLSDFGIARSVQQSASMEVTRAGSFLGTPTYMSPEQCKGSGDITPAADIYSLGITLYMLLAGQPPFESNDPMKLAAMHCFDTPVEIQRINRQVSDGTAALLNRMLAKQPTERPADAAQLVREIELLIRGETSEFDLHPRLPSGAKASWERVFQWTLESPASELWPLVSNTERLNRAAGLQSVVYRTEKDPQLGLRKFGSFRLGGVQIEWEEHPFEWIEGRRMGVLREFSTGPFRWFMSLVELTPTSSGGTQLTHTVRIEPRNWFGRMIANIEAGWKGHRALDRIYKRIDGSLKATKKDPLLDPYEVSKKLSASVSKRIDQRLERMIGLGVPLEVASNLVDYLVAAAPQTLSQIRPLDLADRLGLPGEQVLDVCLVASHCGLLKLRWDVLCPSCRAPATTASVLSQIGEHTACEACDLEFQSNVANAIELVFQAHPEIREVDDGQYCIGGPEHSPHVVSQLRLAAGERIELTIPLATGDYLLRGPRLRTPQPLRVRAQSAPSALDIRLSQLGASKHTPVVRTGPLTLSITNDLDTTQVVKLERTINRSNVVTAAIASAHPRFRELFPDQVFSRHNAIAAEELTLLASRVASCEQLYATRSDSEAYHQIQQALSVVEDCVLAHQGAVIKSVGELLLASFRDSTHAAQAACSITARLKELDQSSDSVIASAIHRGPLLVTTQNGRLDYFGSTSRQVQSLCGQIEEGIAFTEAVFADAAVREFLLRNELVSKHHTFDLPGAPQRLVQLISNPN